MNENLDKLRDPKFYLENFCKIKTKKGGLHPFILNEAQKDLFNTLRDNTRVMILKCRQLGFSTAVAGYFYVNTIMNVGITSALIGYNSDLVSELLDKIKTFIRTTPAALRPTIQYNSKYEISFPKMDSKILILPSSENVGSGYTIHNCLLTELSKLDKAEEKMASLMPAIPLGGTFVIESSPKGVGGLYHRMWTEENDWVKKRYDYWWGYSEKQIKQIEREVNDPQIFAQEYKCSFLQSGRSVFEQKIIDSQRKNLLDIGDMNDEHKVYEEEGWVIYKEPEEEGIYVTGADVSDGVSGGDYSVAIIWDRKTGEEVAMYRGYIAPDRFGDLLDKWGRRYNNSYMVPEINNQGLTTLTILKQKAYPNLYFRPNKFESLGSSMTDKLGWRTTRITRPLMISEYAKALRDGVLTIHSKILIDEMSVFIYDDNDNMRPESKTFHDDSIFSAAIGFQGFKTLYSGKLEQIDNSLYLPKSFSY